LAEEERKGPEKMKIDAEQQEQNKIAQNSKLDYPSF
jgi:hypothetical protein